MAHQCFRSLGTRLPMSPLSQTIGGSGIMFKPTPTLSISSSEYSPFKPVSRLQIPVLTLEDQIAILNSTWRSPNLPACFARYPYVDKSMATNSASDMSHGEMGLIKSYSKSLSEPKKGILSCTATERSGDKLPPKSNDPVSGKPNADQLQHVHDVIRNSLLKLFTSTMDYSVYSKDIVLIDKIRNKTIHGILRYVQQVAFVRVLGHFKFAFVKLEILNTHISQEEGRITIRWRINGISGLRVMLKFWKFRLWNWREIMTSQEMWFDGISHFDVGEDGLVFRHIVDKMIEDKGPQVEVIKQDKAALAAQLGILAALFPQPSSIALSNKLNESLNLCDTNNPGFQPI